MTTKSIGRKHHYLPQAYLAAFTATSKKDGQFYVLDVQNRHSFRASPSQVAAERDFNRVDIEGHPPDVIENGLAPFEGEAVGAIRRVLESETFPNDRDWSLILNLLCLIAVRNPKLRESFNHSRDQVLRRINELLVSDEKIWNHHVTKTREAGEVIDDKVSFEEIKSFVEEDAYDIEFKPEGNLRVELNIIKEILPLLGQRTWTVLIAPIDGPEFVCSDHPVSLVSKVGRSGPVGFGLNETEVFFPLGRRVGFYGTFEPSANKVVQCQPNRVATMNMRILQNADRHVYSAHESFYIWEDKELREVLCKI